MNHAIIIAAETLQFFYFAAVREIISDAPGEGIAERMIYEILHLGEEHGRITCAGYSDQGKARKTG